ncbi:hypothetical protein C8F01DRAFT_122622 [Mycena amicta]|nr:hypothetical protein C8F01DRAFT_122622 [Mycena amicta]
MSSPRLALEILPFELWELVTDALPANSSFLLLARTCHVFNEVCFRRHLQGQGIDSKLRNLQLSEQQVRSLFVYVVQPLPTTKLTVDLTWAYTNPHRVPPALDVLYELIVEARRMPNLEELNIESYESFYLAPWTTRERLHALVSGVARTWHSVAKSKANAKADAHQDTGVVLVCGDLGPLFTWRPTAKMNNPANPYYHPLLHCPPEHHPPPWEANLELVTRTSYPTQTRCHDGRVVRIEPLRQLISVHLHRVAAGALSVFTVNKARNTFFSLVPSNDLPSLALFLRDGDGLLSALSLGNNLRHVELSSVISSCRWGTLRTFLALHSSLERIQYDAYAGVDWGKDLDPLEHPSLTSLRTRMRCVDGEAGSSRSLIPLLYNSPRLRVFEFELEVAGKGVNISGLMRDLESIARRSEDGFVKLKLELRLRGGSSRESCLCAESDALSPHLAVAAALNWLRFVRIEICIDVDPNLSTQFQVELERATQIARSFLSWLVSLPAVQDVEFAFALAIGGVPTHNRLGKWVPRLRLSNHNKGFIATNSDLESLREELLAIMQRESEVFLVEAQNSLLKAQKVSCVAYRVD